MSISVQYYLCNKCRFITTLSSRMEDHFQVHTDPKQSSQLSYFDCFDRLKLLKCISCDFSTTSLVLLRYHLIRNHDQQQFELKATLKTCKKCNFCTHSNYLWIRHPIYGSCKDKKTSKRKRVNVSMKKNGKWYLCDKCDFRTLYWKNSKKHIIYKHTPLEEIDWEQCKTCLAKFKTIDALKRHQNYVHLSAEDRLHCAMCDYSTPSRYQLANHFNRKHARPEEIQWLECYHCGSKFKDKEQIKYHLKSHTGEVKRYKCDQCPFKTTHKNNLSIHKVMKHGIDDAKWFKCAHCDYISMYKRSIESHVLMKHNKDGNVFKCEKCDYNTRVKSYLRQHMMRKHKPLNITCENCSFVTTSEEKLQRHMFNKHTVHTEEEKLTCTLCTYFSFNKRNLVQHLQLRHKIGENIRWYDCTKCNYKSQYKNSLVGHMFKVHNDGKLLECGQCLYKTGSPFAMEKHKMKHKKSDRSQKTAG